MIEYRKVDSLPEKALAKLRDLYICAGWITPEDDAGFLAPMLAGSEVAVCAFSGEEVVGFGRALSDGCSDAYIQDVVVDPGFRKQGIGGNIVLKLERALREKGVDWIGLVGAPGTENFYAQLGLTPKRDHTLWCFEKSLSD